MISDIKMPFPRIMISDIKMPRCSGLELLEWVQSHPKCSVVPVLILSTSARENDVTAAYRLGANTYFQKPLEMNRLVRMLREAMSYWSTAKLPNSPEHCD
jgi:DNA-binding NarL/FixJ family response regulator